MLFTSVQQLIVNFNFKFKFMYIKFNSIEYKLENLKSIFFFNILNLILQNLS